MDKAILIKRLDSLIRSRNKEIKRIKAMVGEYFKERGLSRHSWYSTANRSIRHFVECVRIHEREINLLSQKRNDLKSGNRSVAEVLYEIREEIRLDEIKERIRIANLEVALKANGGIK